MREPLAPVTRPSVAPNAQHLAREARLDALLELLRSQPDGLMRIGDARAATGVHYTTFADMLNDLEAARLVRRVNRRQEGVRGGFRGVQAVHTYCRGCNGHGTWDRLVVSETGQQVDVEETPCTHCSTTGLIATKGP